MMVEVELFDAALTVLVSKSIFDLVSLRKLTPKKSGCANDDTAITGIGHTFQSKSMST